MDTNTTVACAAVGAVVATGITLVVNQLQKVKDAKAQAAEVTEAHRTGQMQGWFEGREALLQHFQRDLEPKDFTQAR